MGPIVSFDAKFRAIIDSLQIRPSDFLIGVDHGTDHWFKLGFTPSLAVGDWDSLKSQDVLQWMSHVSLKQDKDRSDLYFALQAASRSPARELICLGLSGGRPDHHLAVLLELAHFAANGKFGKTRVRMIGSDAEYWFLSRYTLPWKQKLNPGQVVSLFALSSNVQGVSTRGLQYALKNGVLKPSSHGLSNVAVRGECEVRLKSGKLMVVLPYST